MTRKEQIETLIQEYLSEYMTKETDVIIECYQKNFKEIKNHFLQRITEGFLECMQKQKKLRYIIFSPLISSVITKSYEMQIAFYDANLYLDKQPIYKYWSIKTCFINIENGKEQILKKLKQKIIRFQEYEMMEFYQEYEVLHFVFSLLMIMPYFSEIFSLPESKNIEMEKKVEIAYGMFLDKTILLYRKEGKEE